MCAPTTTLTTSSFLRVCSAASLSEGTGEKFWRTLLTERVVGKAMPALGKSGSNEDEGERSDVGRASVTSPRVCAPLGVFLTLL